MQKLLQAEYYSYVVELQSIEHIELHAELHATSIEKKGSTFIKFLTFLEEIKDANQTYNLCTQICAYLKILSKKKKSTIHVNTCKINNSLLMKADCLWVPEGKNSQLKLKLIKKIHN